MVEIKRVCGRDRDKVVKIETLCGEHRDAFGEGASYVPAETRVHPTPKALQL